ncbi:hypothetical protein NYP20_19160 [Pseudomonas sp. N3-W]|uniref:Type III secretion protein n=1 Tax=Pseudomonas fungipugnans TaxID=3024217 RepID=A0ABT6QJT0_9PSED|nr:MULTISPECIES: hypothetical protein [unclassified Pseudomonas]MDI2591021.1 hypothetical protein [Pseudomonas sp. 681]UWF47450.1 hypothetical protein NYP20_19160 [Pseudomonas sp. N3-W]
MSLINVSQAQALAWVRWWVEGARGADRDWRLGEEGVTPELLAWLRRHPGAWLDRHLHMTSTLPPAPNAHLLPLLGADSGQWSRVLSLVVTVCAGSEALHPGALDRADLIWCRRLGRALQPGHWLPVQWPQGTPHIQGLRLLRAWVGEPVWQRLRLRFARPAIEEAERLAFDDLPAARLAALWQAVVWYASTLSSHKDDDHVDPPQPDA